MPDLSPDLSPYAALAKSGQSGFGAMDPNSILGLVAHSRDLQTQSAIADALRANPDDPGLALKSVLANPNAFPTAQTISSFTNAQSAQFELNRNYMREAAGSMASLVSDPDATVDKFNALAPLLQRYHVPDAMIRDVINSASTDGKLDHDKLVTLNNWIHDNAGLPGQPEATVTTPYGTTKIPPSQALRGNQGATPTGVAPTGVVPTPRPRPAPGTASSAAPQPPEEDPATAATREVRQRYEGGYGIGGGTVTTAPPGSDKAWDASTNLYMGSVSRDYRGDVLPMEKAIALLKKNPDLTGRGMTEFNNIKNIMHSMKLIPDDKMGETQDFESLGKYFSQFANNASLQGTDARMFQQIAASPGMEKLGSTNLNLARVILAMRRMQQVGLTEFRNQRGADGRPLPSGYYNDWMNSWSARQDPMGFVWDTMSKEEQQAYGKDHWSGKDASGPAAKELKRLEASRAAAQRSPGVTSDGQ